MNAPRPARALALLVAAVAALLAGSPAASAQGAASVFCQPAGGALAPLASSPPVRASARGLLREKDTDFVTPDSDIPAAADPEIPEGRITIPVYWHVIAASTDPQDGWIGDATIARQIYILNRAYSGGFGGADTGFRFRLAQVTRTVNKTWFEMADFDAETAAKTALRHGGATNLDVYSNSGSSFLGYAYLPAIIAEQRAYQVLDGVVLNFQALPGGSLRDFSVGHTATHEIGHWLGLQHTFESGCDAPGDEVDDTPPEAEATQGCPVGKDTCPAPGEDPVHNFMDYSFDSCYREFTPGQIERAREQYAYWRAERGT